MTLIGVILALCLLSNDVMDYNIVSQGKTIIPGVDDGEEMRLTDVSPELWLLAQLTLSFVFIFRIAACFAYIWVKSSGVACVCQMFWCLQK